MALMLPVLFAFMFTTFEAGHYLWTEHKVIKATRQGARYIARLPFDSFDCTNGTIENPMVEGIKNAMRTGSTQGGVSKVKGWDNNNSIVVRVNCVSNSTMGTDKGLYTKLGEAPVVTVSSLIEYPAIVGLLGFDTSNTFVRGQAQAAVVGL